MSDTIKFLIEIEPAALTELPLSEERIRNELEFYVARLVRFYWPVAVKSITVTRLDPELVLVNVDALVRLQGNAVVE